MRAPRPDTGGTEPGLKPRGRGRDQALSSRRFRHVVHGILTKGPFTDPRPTQGHRHSKARRGPVSSLSAVFPHTPVASRPTKRPVLTTPETVTITVGTQRRQRQVGWNGPEGEKLIANKDQSEPEVGQHHVGTERGLD